MNMQTMRNVFAQTDSSSQTLGQPQQPARALLPPLTAYSLPTPTLRLEEKPKMKDLAQKRASEAYATIMAGVGFQAQCSLR